MAQQECTDFQFKHETLKEILEELGKLYTTTSTRHKVFEKLKTYLTTYCNETYLNDFYGKRDYGSGVSSYGGSIQLLTYAGQKVSEAILKSPPSWTSQVQDTHVSHTGRDCAEKYFNALKKCLPKTFAALFFLFFNCDSDCTSFGGGQWSGQNVNGQGSGSSGQNLYQWLTDSSDDLPGGFSGGELHDKNTGQSLVEQLKNAVSLKPDGYTGSLQNALCALMFVCEWEYALTGHAVLFVWDFCNHADRLRGQFTNKYPQGNFDTFMSLCTSLKADLDP
ncbi:hypothetical protein X943_002984, partial [Babesia divergens]